jgi:Tfp pilus assembly PilM family ATPase/Tfp pilus assembly protein PilN
MLKGYLSIEVTSSKIRYLFVSKVDGGYRILKAGMLLHALNVLSAGELTRRLQELIQVEKFSPIRLFVTLCLQDNYIRQVNLPKMEISELQMAIRAEIEQHPVFNNRAFDYLYQSTVHTGDKGHVVFAAVEQSVLDYLLSECRSLGVPFSHLEIAPMNLKEILHLLEPGVESQAVLVVNDQSSYLMVYWGKQFRLIHQSSIGQEQLYPRQNGKINQPVLTGFVGELKRAFNSYQSQHRLEIFNKVWLLWDAQGAAGFETALAGPLGMNVESLTLEHLSKWVMDPDRQGANPIYALAATPAVIYLEKIKEQFPLTYFFRDQHVTHYVLKWVTVIVLVLGFAGYFLGIKSFENYQKQKSLKMEMAASTDAINKLQNTLQDLYRKREKFLIVRQGLFEHGRYIKSLNKTQWAQVLTAFTKDMPNEMTLTAFKFQESGPVTFSGESLKAENVSGLIRRMDDSGVMQQTEFDFFTEKLVDDQKVYSFEIKAQLLAQESLRKSGKHE